MKKLLEKRVVKISIFFVILLLVLIVLLFLSGMFSSKYDLEKIVEMTGRDNLDERDFEFGNIKCMNYYYSGKDESNYDRLSFYVFDSKYDAIMAYNIIYNSWFSEITDQGNSYVEGWEDVCDAFVMELVCRSENMIITTETSVISAWIEGDEESDCELDKEFEGENKSVIDDGERLKDFVLKEFGLKK